MDKQTQEFETHVVDAENEPEYVEEQYATNTHISDVIRGRLNHAGKRYFANDNISEFINEDERDMLIDELTSKFEGVLDSLIIDREHDPNSHGTPRRLAKMYVNEIMQGRYHAPPTVTAFPNDDADTRYGGMIVVRAEITSMCSHHHQPVKGVCYIGLLPSVKVIGLSKYARIAQHCARRGTLQEELTKQIADEIAHATKAPDIAVYIQAEHGCMVNRGVEACSSLTQTCELRGQFFNPSVKNEYLEYVRMQQMHSSKAAH